MTDLVLKEFEPVRRYYPPVGAFENDLVRGVYVDTETTGLDPETDEIIQLALVPFSFSTEGFVYSTSEPFIALQEPVNVSISEEITRITGITPEMVKGKRIDPAELLEALEGAKFVVAHHADFDRKFLEKGMSVFESMHFGCSMTDIPWDTFGYRSKKLEWIAFKQLNMWYEAHRADMDAYMGVHLLASTLPDGKTGMQHVLAAARKKYVRIYAIGAPFNTRHVLKQRGYKWNAGENGLPNAWWKDVELSQHGDEEQWLRDEAGSYHPDSFVFGAQSRFSDRIGRTNKEAAHGRAA